MNRFAIGIPTNANRKLLSLEGCFHFLKISVSGNMSIAGSLLLLILLIIGCGGNTARSIKQSIPEQTLSKNIISKPNSAPVLVKSNSIITLVDDLDRNSLLLAIEKSMLFFDRLKDTDIYYVGSRQCTVRDMKETLRLFSDILKGPEPEKTREAIIRDKFDFYQSIGDDGRGKVIFTGYYEPILNGSWIRTEKFRYPIYRTPEEIVTLNSDKGKNSKIFKEDRRVDRTNNNELLPSYKRAEIDGVRSLEGRNLEIIWVDDAVDLFFLHIQGSGKIRLPDGKLVQVGYAQSNGYPYRSIANYMLDNGLLVKKELSMQGIKQSLREHPEMMQGIFNYNERYVFFRLLDKGPFGALNVPVTGGRTIAIDPEVYPIGALAFIKTQKPLFNNGGEVVKWIPFSRFVLSQDTGGAIKGAGKIDIYCGSGHDAEAVAGRLKEAGELFFLIKKR